MKTNRDIMDLSKFGIEQFVFCFIVKFL